MKGDETMLYARRINFSSEGGIDSDSAKAQREAEEERCSWAEREKKWDAEQARKRQAEHQKTIAKAAADARKAIHR